MTNMSSGSKRSWDAAGESRERKRPRDDPKDWRDVYLKSNSSKGSPSSKRDGHERDRKIRHDSDRRRRSREHGRPRREREDSKDRRPDAYSQNRLHGSRQDEDEREEGEISPRPSSPGMKDTPASPSEQPPEPKPDPLPEMELEISSSPVEDALAARRIKRRAILAKYAGIASGSASFSPSPITPGLSSAVQALQPPSAVSDHVAPDNSTPGENPTNGTPVKQGSASPSLSPGPDFALAKADDENSSEIKYTTADGSEQISAADYDPSLDRREDEDKRVQPLVKPAQVEEIVESEEEDDVDDMFEMATSEKKTKKIIKVKKAAKPVALSLASSTLDSAADPEGYYTVILGEQLDGGRYQVFSSLGKGMFANVVRARVLAPEPNEPSGREVAIKIIRCQESMYKAGLKEVQILHKLKQADPEDKKHIVRIERTFEHRGHLCIVFESLSMNLRDVVKRFGKDVGLNIRAVRAYAHQLFLALSLLRKLSIMHADIKPDNILVNEHKSLLKLCDLGSASDAADNEITPYLVSRFYRAPEIIMGAPYDPAIDIWSIGCTLYELYTGKILFPGRSNNQMLLLMMELKGRFNSKMIKKAKFGENYFDEMGGFNSIEKDRVLGNDVVKKVHLSKPVRDLRSRLMPPASVKMKDDESKLLTAFIDLLDKCLALDPARRITPREGLVHPFIRG
ncbi:hypothetical protein D9757_003392 [Collybiopsis confluens]|uniref:non-specific serine/threonine protein kinase n=1 Tax=Collybiopsis confluens TaxID=2823264 RepID=A0A8H5HTK8_9AGAR|nr:hypothetical protein D9757_003392 [Collybiopsis confluens]